MWRVTWRGMAAHKTRLLLTLVAITLGVAFVAGTMVFSDTIRRTFDQLVGQSAADVIIEPDTQVTAWNNGAVLVPAPTLAAVRSVPGVERAVGSLLVDGVRVIGPTGKAVGVVGAPAYGAAWTADPDLSPVHLTSGRAPARSGEVAVDSQTAGIADLRVGGTVRLVTAGPALRPRIVGIFRYGSTGNLAGASIVAFDPVTARTLLLDGQPGYTSVSVKATAGVSPDELAGRVRAATVGQPLKVITAQQSADEVAKQVDSALRFVDIFLLLFAGVALVVGSFIILNTFTMLVAQRWQDLALLRAVGATRRQVLASVLGEAALLGVIASVLGLGLGLTLAVGLEALLGRVGFSIPSTGLAVRASTVVASVAVGVLVSLVASYLPARRASRVPPVTALRQAAGLQSRPLRRRTLAGMAVVGVGAAAIAGGATGTGGSAAAVVGAGALLAFVGVVAVAPALAVRSIAAISVLGRPWLHATARLAVHNARRNPRRTASTAAALMIGVALVAAFGIFGTSAKASVDRSVDKALLADFVVQGQGGRPFSTQVADDLRAVPGVAVVSQTSVIPVLLGDTQTTVSALDTATVTQVLDVVVRQGSLSSLGTDGLAVDDRMAGARGWRLGRVVDVRFPAGPVPLTVRAVYTYGVGTNGMVISREALAATRYRVQDTNVLVRLAPGVSAASVTPAINDALSTFPIVTVQDHTAYKNSIHSQVNQLLALIYALLGLAVVIAVLGIVNTLALSVVERTREIGLLRAVGTTRRQLRRMIRVESVVIAVFGAVVGEVLGLVLGVAIQRTLRDQGIDVLALPVALLVVMLVTAVIVGVLAAALPARRAARMNPLAAIQTE